MGEAAEEGRARLEHMNKVRPEKKDRAYREHTRLKHHRRRSGEGGENDQG